jgi:hypothetical protein
MKRFWATHFTGRLTSKQKTVLKNGLTTGYLGIGFVCGGVCATAHMMDVYDMTRRDYARGDRGMSMGLVIMGGLGPGLMMWGLSMVAWPAFIPLWVNNKKY